MQRGTVTSGSYGHSRILQNDTPVVVHQDIQGRFYPVSSQEQQIQGTLGQVTSDFYYYVINQELVEELRDQMNASLTFRIQNVRDKKTGRVIQAGPYDINGIMDETGELHHWQIQLRRVA